MRLLTGLLCAAAALLTVPASGFAAEAAGVVADQEPVPVREYGAHGVPAGAFRIFPELSLSTFYDDNIYRTQSATISDVIYNPGARVAVQSQWSRHMLNLRGSIDHFAYASENSEDRTSWEIGSDGRLDVVRGVSVSGAASYAQRYEGRNSPNEIGPVTGPIGYKAGHVEAAVLYRPRRVGLALRGSHDTYAFDRRDGVDNADRNHRQTAIAATASYDFSPGYGVFLRASYDRRGFARRVDRNGLRRNSTGSAVDVGMQMLVTRLITGEVFAGYVRRNYVAPLPDVDGVNYGASLRWTPSERTTVQISAARRIDDTVLPGVAAADNREAGVLFDYEFLRNLLIRARFDFVDTQFPGSAREDQQILAGLALRYLVGDHVSAELRYDYATRSSSAPGEDFDANILSANLNLHL